MKETLTLEQLIKINTLRDIELKMFDTDITPEARQVIKNELTKLEVLYRTEF